MSLTEDQAKLRLAERIADLHFKTIEKTGANPSSFEIAVVAWNEIKAIAREGIEGTDEWYRSEVSKMNAKFVENTWPNPAWTPITADGAC